MITPAVLQHSAVESSLSERTRSRVAPRRYPTLHRRKKRLLRYPSLALQNRAGILFLMVCSDDAGARHPQPVSLSLLREVSPCPSQRKSRNCLHASFFPCTLFGKNGRDVNEKSPLERKKAELPYRKYAHRGARHIALLAWGRFRYKQFSPFMTVLNCGDVALAVR